MSHKGFSHLGLSTLDLDKTRKFYEDILGFRSVVADIIKIEEGGRIRHIFLRLIPLSQVGQYVV
jgi:catechol 2,3-dioxygenase-like lactoylglutathione lyase family enzyme